MGLALTSWPKGSGEVIKCVHFLTYGYLTLSHTPIKINLSLLPSASTSRKKEELMTREYGRLNTAIFHPFSPLVFTSSGGMGPTAKVVYKKLASMLAMKQNRPYSQTMDWLRCTLSFSLLRSAIMCLRGSRSRAGQPAHHNLELDGGTIDRAINDSRLACSQDTA